MTLTTQKFYNLVHFSIICLTFYDVCGSHVSRGGDEYRDGQCLFAWGGGWGEVPPMERNIFVGSSLLQAQLGVNMQALKSLITKYTHRGHLLDAKV